jgi:methionine sulfoxide reductase heme-binding subunit
LTAPFISRYWIRRASRLFLLCALAVFICVVAYALTPPPDVRHRLSMGTAYAAMCFLAATLMLGPWNVLRRHHTPVSYDLRRDVGITAGTLALLHTGIGLTVHLRGRMWMYFFKSLHPLRVQASAFGNANYTGLVAAALFAMLLAISNDWSLRSLGTPRWKSLQRWTYVAFALTLAHGILFQWVEKRQLPWVLFFAALALVAIVAQSLGYLQRRRHAESQ